MGRMRSFLKITIIFVWIQNLRSSAVQILWTCLFREKIFCRLLHSTRTG
uniref:Uncharacterized protein n=1 Tax=Arundo donax TaxID=35708 RepID=A0A0A8YDU2_ARUDO